MRKNKFMQILTEGLRLFFIVVLVSGLALGATPVPVAHAATITVNSTADTTIAGDGKCTLREAINNANANLDTTGGDCTAGQAAPTVDTITLPAGTYTLGGITGEDLNLGGDLDILQPGGPLIISGAGATTTIIDGSYNDRVFHIDPFGVGGLVVNVAGVTVQHGNAPFGGGGGIYNRRGTVNIDDSTFSSNLAISGPGASGGGILNDDGTVNIDDSTLSSNQASVEGGGIYNTGIAGGIVNIDDSTLSGNWVLGGGGGGGGIRNSFNCTVNITNTTLSSNIAIGGSGGGIRSDGLVNLADSTLSSNTATGFSGGGIENWGAGRLNIVNSTLSSNQAGGPGGGGGGIYNTSGFPVNIANSTLSGNQTNGDGGGIYHMGVALNLDNVTIATNTADADGNNIGDGGGIFHVGGAATLKNTIIARNSDNTVAGNIHPDCSTPFAFTSQGYNLIGNGTGSGATIWQATDQVGTNISPVDPLLGPLADNGGNTFTHALLTGSPAIDKGICADISLNPVTADQRGVARPQGATCDIGAYEAEPKLSIGKTVTPMIDVPCRSVVTYTVVLSNSSAVYASNVLMTDTLPVEVDFASWVAQPTGANQANDQITWSGTVSASMAITFTFAVTHTGDYGDVVTNTAEYRYTPIISGSGYVTFTVVVSPTIYLPTIQRSNVITS